MVKSLQFRPQFESIQFNTRNQTASSFGFQGRSGKMTFVNADGSQKICFSMREQGVCSRESRGEECGMLHLAHAALKGCSDVEYLTGAEHRCSNVWKCHGKHPMDRKSKALRGKAAGHMLRHIDVDKFQ